MNLTALRAFHAVAVEGGFRRAAQRLNVTQPAVSAQIKALQSGCGVELLVRTGRGVLLTELGRDRLALLAPKDSGSASCSRARPARTAGSAPCRSPARASRCRSASCSAASVGSCG